MKAWYTTNLIYKFIFFVAITGFHFMSKAEFHTAHATTLTEESHQIGKGSLVVICGSMCSGKTEVLIKIVERLLRSRKRRIQAFKHYYDQRTLSGNPADGATNLTSRNGSSIPCISVKTGEDILNFVTEHDIEIVAIDEAQFFETHDLQTTIQQLLNQNRRVLLSGLDLDFKHEPFNAMGTMLAWADTVIKLSAVCTQCGDDTYCLTQRLVNGQPAHYKDPLIMVGDQEYEPRCRKCHQLRTD